MKHKNAEQYGYKVISSVLEHENPYFTLHKYDVMLPDGKTTPFWNLEELHPFAISIPLFPDNTVILVGQYRVNADFYSWEFPMGGSNGTDILEEARRELKEETGYTAHSWKEIGTHFVGPGKTNAQGVTFVAENLEKGDSEPDNTEFLRIKKVTVPEMGKMIESGIIMSGSTIVAYHYLEKYLREL